MSLPHSFYSNTIKIQMLQSDYNPNNLAVRTGNTSIATRQKFGSLAKKVLRYLYENRTKVHRFQQLIQQSQKILKDPKKSIEVVCFYEGVGLLTRISSEQYIYSGFRGIATRLMQYEANRRRGIRQNHIQFDQVQFEGKTLSIRAQLLAGLFFNEVLFGVIFQNGKTTNKNQMELMVEDFSSIYKDTNTKTFLPDVLNILCMLGFIEKNENTEVVSYLGPDLRVYDELTMKKNSEKLQALLQKEQAFFSDGQVQNGAEQQDEMELESLGPLKTNLAFLPELSFAVLKAKNWQFPVKKTCLIIGRANEHNLWQVDLDLPYKSVSRQHAAILYNFATKRWEIRCLSRKNLIKVDGQRYAYRDKDIWLKDRSVLEICHQKMMFCLVQRED